MTKESKKSSGQTGDLGNGIWPFDIRELDGLGLTMLITNVSQQAGGGKYRNWMKAHSECSDGSLGRWRVITSLTDKTFTLIHEHNYGPYRSRQELRKQLEEQARPLQTQAVRITRLLQFDSNPLDAPQLESELEAVNQKLLPILEEIEQTPEIALDVQTWPPVTFDQAKEIFGS